jgi:hypothetical protein
VRVRSALLGLACSGLLVVAAVAAAGGVRIPTTAGETAIVATERQVDRFVALRAGDKSRLYVLTGRDGPIGSLSVTCSRLAKPGTAYNVGRLSAESLVAVDGRGVSRAAVLRPGRLLRGAMARSGAERWHARMSREPEDVAVELSLVALGPSVYSSGCTFWLRGIVNLTRR